MNQTNSKWSERKEVKKGDIGEALVIDWLIKKGYVPYSPEKDSGAHPFDHLCATPDKKTIFVAESKTKPARTFYPDTGINISHYNDYSNIKEKYGMDVFLFFIDEDAGKIYGASLSKLSKRLTVMHKGKEIEYPLKQGKIIYFPLVSMTDVAKIPEEKNKSLRNLSNRNERYIK